MVAPSFGTELSPSPVPSPPSQCAAPPTIFNQLGAVLGEDDAHSLVGLATPSTYRGCREIAYATLLDLHVAARETSAQAGQKKNKQTEDVRGGAAMTEAQRETVRCALLRGLSDPDDEGELVACFFLIFAIQSLSIC